MRRDTNFYKHGLTKYHFLEYIRKYAPERGVTSSELVRAFGIYKQYVHEMLKLLVKHGLLEAVNESENKSPRYRYFITQRAYDLLRKYNAQSFFDENFLPFKYRKIVAKKNGMKVRTILYA